MLHDPAVLDRFRPGNLVAGERLGPCTGGGGELHHQCGGFLDAVDER